MTSPAVVAPNAKPRRWLLPALIFSLAINGLLAGVVVRAMWNLRSQAAMTGGAIEPALRAFVGTLPADRREELRRLGAPERPATLRPLRQEVRNARNDAVRLFTSDPFNKQAFIAAQARLLDAETNLRRAIQRALPELGERLTAAERRAYLSWRGHGRGPGGFRRGGPPRGPGGDLDDDLGPAGAKRP